MLALEASDFGRAGSNPATRTISLAGLHKWCVRQTENLKVNVRLVLQPPDYAGVVEQVDTWDLKSHELRFV